MSRFFQLFTASVGGGLLAAYVFTITLEPDLAFSVLFLPGVFVIATAGGVMGGLLIFPVVYFCLRRKPLHLVLPILYGLVGIEIYLASLFLDRYLIETSIGFSILLLLVLRVVPFKEPEA